MHADIYANAFKAGQLLRVISMHHPNLIRWHWFSCIVTYIVLSFLFQFLKRTVCVRIVRQTWRVLWIIFRTNFTFLAFPQDHCCNFSSPHAFDHKTPPSPWDVVRLHYPLIFRICDYRVYQYDYDFIWSRKTFPHTPIQPRKSGWRAKL
jgi:hypothetical protein